MCGYSGEMCAVLCVWCVGTSVVCGYSGERCAVLCVWCVGTAVRGVVCGYKCTQYALSDSLACGIDCVLVIWYELVCLVFRNGIPLVFARVQC